MLQTCSRSPRALCQRSEAQRLDLGRLIEEVAPTVAGATGLTCKLDVEPIEVPGNVALHLVLAVNELVFSARKHAYSGRDGCLRLSSVPAESLSAQRLRSSPLYTPRHRDCRCQGASVRW